MQTPTLHPSEQELLLAADGELQARRANEIRVHLASCQTCRVRVQEMQSTTAELVQLRQETAPRLPSIEGPRALLRARLAELAGETPQSSSGPAVLVRLSLMAAGLAAVFVLGAWLKISLSSPRAEPAEVHLIPDLRLTPGAVVAVTSVRDVCSVGPSKRKLISPALGEKVFQEYGITRPRPRAYEVDYLIDPGLGGSSDIQNLWPEPYSTTWSARVKDALEDRLHELVCSGTISLATAQQEIATNWIAAYKKYFKTEMPLPAHLAFAKDQPWE